MYSFFIDGIDNKDNIVSIVENDYNHIKNVLRMNIGDKIQICDKKTGESYLAEIHSIDKEKVNCTIIKELDNNEPFLNITIFQGIPKADKMDYIVQKSTELGAKKIVPVEMKYCVAKLNNPEKKIERWRKIAEASAKQCKRNIIPKIESAIDIRELIDEIKDYDLTIVAFENEKEHTLKSILDNNKDIKSIAIIIGPEGGISPEEIELFMKNNVKIASLGNRILRTETAAIAILAMIMYEFEL